MTLDLKALRDGVVQFGSTALSSARVLALIDELTEARSMSHTTEELVSAVNSAAPSERFCCPTGPAPLSLRWAQR